MDSLLINNWISIVYSLPLGFLLGIYQNNK